MTLVRTPLVDREAELASLRDVLDEAMTSGSRVVAVVGEAGVGKSRLVDELVVYAELRGANVAVGEAFDAEGVPPFWVWKKAFDSLERPVEAFDPWVRQAGEVPADADLAAEARFELFQTVAEQIRSEAAEKPLLILLEDVHWADRASLLLLAFLGKYLGNSPVLLLVTVRNEAMEAGHPITSTLAELSRTGTLERINVGALAEQYVPDFVEAHTGVPPTRTQVRSLYRQSEGNAYFMKEAAHLMARGAKKTSLDWETDIPATLADVMRERTKSISEECFEFLETGSCIGRELDLRVLGRLAGLDFDTVLDLVDEAVEARILEEPEKSLSRYRYSHALLRDWLHSQISAHRRAGLHLELARILEESLESAGPRAERASQIAYHYGQALSLGTAEKVIEFGRLAAELADASTAYEEAVRQRELVLEALRSSSEPDQAAICEALIELGAAFERAGDPEESRARYREALALASDEGLREKFAEAALHIAWYIPTPARVDTENVRLLEKALEGLPDDPTTTRSRILARLALGYVYSREVVDHDPVAVATQAVDAAIAAGDEDSEAFGRIARIYANSAPEFVDARESDARAVVDLGESPGRRDAIGWARVWIMSSCLERGDFELARKQIADGKKSIDESRRPVELWVIGTLETMATLFEGRVAEAEKLANEAFAIGRQSMPENATAFYAAQTMGIRREEGRLGEFEQIIRAYVSQYPDSPHWEPVITYLEAYEGRIEEAAASLGDQSRNDFSRFPRNGYWLVSMSISAETCAEIAERGGALDGTGVRAAAESIYRLLEPFFDRFVLLSGALVCLGSVQRYAGLAAATLGKFEAAEIHIERARELHQRAGSPLYVAHSDRDLAWLYKMRGDSRAPALAEKAAAAYDEMGLPRRAERARNLARL